MLFLNVNHLVLAAVVVVVAVAGYDTMGVFALLPVALLWLGFQMLRPLFGPLGRLSAPVTAGQDSLQSFCGIFFCFILIGTGLAYLVGAFGRVGYVRFLIAWYPGRIFVSPNRSLSAGGKSDSFPL
jgi:hypothetical protein